MRPLARVARSVLLVAALAGETAGAEETSAVVW
jgi:hypothetical protein